MDAHARSPPQCVVIMTSNHGFHIRNLTSRQVTARYIHKIQALQLACLQITGANFTPR